MKKYLSFFNILCLVLFSFSFLLFSRYTFAAGETYTWSGTVTKPTITVTGGGLSQSSTLNGPAGGGLGNGFYGGAFVINSTCHLQIELFVYSDLKNGYISSASPIQPTYNNQNCINISKQYQNTRITIGGTPPSGSETDKQKTVDVTIYVPTTNTPNSITITIGKQKKTARKTSGTQGLYYHQSFLVDPGKWQVCAPPVLSCQNFTKVKYIPLDLVYGETAIDQSIDVSIKDTLIFPTGSSCNVGPYTVQLKKGNTIVTTAQTNTVKIEPTQDQQGAAGSGSLTTAIANLHARLKGVTQGNYQICIPHFDTCKDFSKQKGNLGSITFDVHESDTRNMCSGLGSGPTLPPPPSPPCTKWNKGQCQTFGTALGTLDTDPTGFVKTIFDLLLSVSGGIALLLIIRSAYQLMTSQGKPEQAQQGREQLVAAIVGLVFIIFSFVILQVLGFDILHIPGFGR